MKKLFMALCVAALSPMIINANNVWVADNGDGTYTNPIIHADYSDPDLIRDGDDYYMIASSFNCVPGIPILHSKDLVNWTIVNHVYENFPFSQYTRVIHGRGSWAPSIRKHDDTFYVYFCTPEEGLFAATTKDIRGKWDFHHVLQIYQWEDPCPFWDDDGKAWLVRSKLCGGPVYLHRMSDDGLTVLDPGKIVYENRKENPVLEGLKIMKRNSYYYIFAPAGGVGSGWQTVLRSKNIEGPYESRRVLDEGNGINGPHQGGLVETQTGEWWFIHFQDKDAYGRIAHLQPAKWSSDDWIVMGDDSDGDGCGIPVITHKKPNVGKNHKKIITPQTTDEFDSDKLGLQWQWQATQSPEWYSLSAKKGSLRLYSMPSSADHGNIYYAPNLLMQKFPALSFSATTKVDASELKEGERAGLVIFGLPHFYVAVERREGNLKAVLYSGNFRNCGNPPRQEIVADLNSSTIYIKADVTAESKGYFSYSEDGKNFIQFDKECEIKKGKWIGAKIGIFCINVNVHKGDGYVDFDYFRVEETK